MSNRELSISPRKPVFFPVTNSLVNDTDIFLFKQNKTNKNGITLDILFFFNLAFTLSISHSSSILKMLNIFHLHSSLSILMVLFSSLFTHLTAAAAAELVTNLLVELLLKKLLRHKSDGVMIWTPLIKTVVPHSF